MPPELIYIEVAPTAPVFGTYTYSVNPENDLAPLPGQRALIPFGRRKITGYILKTHVEASALNFAVKSVDYIMDAHPFFPPEMLEFYRWIAGYYKYPLGLTLEAALPGGINVAENTIYSVAVTGRPGSLSQTQECILDCLTQKPRTLKSLQRFTGLGLKEIRRTLNALLKNGQITTELMLNQATRAKTEKWVRLVPEAQCTTKRMTAARLKVLEILSNTPEIALRELLDKAQATASVVQKLAVQGIVEICEQRVYRDPLGFAIERDQPLSLNMAQQYALKQILQGLDNPDVAPKPVLLQGVTGSGKTELYLQAAQAALDKGRSVLILVPEIALITQTEHRFKARFGENVAILHSALSAGERFDQWCRILNGEVQVVVGVRSAVFAPLQNLGLIVVDEEHDASYKQESGLKYHARDAAIVRGRQSGCPVILGSATPSLQTAYNARQKKYLHLTLPERINDQQLAAIEIVDMRREQSPNKMITPTLQKAIAAALAQNEQVLLFLNRRGFTPSLLCKDCGETLTCRNCDISLTYHKHKEAAVCHFCGYTQPAAMPCEKCDSGNIIPLGFGIQRVEEHVRAMFPEARVARLDRDTASDRKAMLDTFRNLQQGLVDILLGTQMVAKGHDFPNITLVGIICADMSLNLPDFRADETTFQLLTQVAGRSGRGAKTGRVVLQTYNPEHSIIKAACTQDYSTFFNHEIETRKLLNYPPFSRVAQIRINGKSAKLAKDAALALGEFCQKQKLVYKEFAGLELLGPVEAPIARLSNWYRWHMLLKCANAQNLHSFVEGLLQTAIKSAESEDVRITVDIDPVSLM